MMTIKTFLVFGFLVMCLTFQHSAAIQDEYEGYYHYHQRDITKDEILLDASDIKLSAEVWSAVCEQIDECRAFNDRGFLKSFPRNQSVDSYISHRSCGEHGKAKVVNGSCLSPNASYVACEDKRGHLDTFYTVKASYRLPPNLVAQACDIDDRCVAFMVTNDRQDGYLLEHFRSPTVHGVYTLVNNTMAHNSNTGGGAVRVERGARLRAVSGVMQDGGADARWV